MASLKTLVTLIGIVASFLLLPQENRLMLFHSSPDAGYGYIQASQGESIRVFAKNTTSNTVDLRLGRPHRNISLNYSSNVTVDLDSAGILPPHSYSFIDAIYDTKANGSAVTVQGTNSFTKPRGLAILTDSEKDMNFIAIMAVIFGFTALGFELARITGDPNSEIGIESQNVEDSKNDEDIIL